MNATPAGKGKLQRFAYAALTAASVLAVVVTVPTVPWPGSGESLSTGVTTSSQPGSSFSAISSSLNSTSSVTRSCGIGAQLIPLNGTLYCADDVANDTVLGGPGYSYFLNNSVTFDGVKFQTICPSIYRGCPGSNSSSTMMYAGAVRFNMIFPDGTNETAGAVIGDLTYVPILSSHSNPQAGMLIEIEYGANETTDHVLLLVTGAVATVTTTETLTTQVSQATTSYAIPTTNCTIVGLALTTTTTTTITVGAASTTTVTVTTTSTSYTQTATLTSCTYSIPTVTSTSTVTITANP